MHPLNNQIVKQRQIYVPNKNKMLFWFHIIINFTFDFPEMVLMVGIRYNILVIIFLKSGSLNKMKIFKALGMVLLEV